MNTPPFNITPEILQYVANIQEILGELKALSLRKPSVKLRKESKIKTIHHSLAIEGNSLTESQITDIIENKRVLGSKKQILEVQNALKLYDHISNINPHNEKAFLSSHKILMEGLIENPGKYRNSAVGIFKNGKVAKMAPSYKMVPRLMSTLFSFLIKDHQTLPLIKACIFHYELELIHPFLDGNGRMGRLWQQLLLMKISPVFEYLPVETLIHKNQKKYYEALEKSDQVGNSTPFVTFSLKMILDSFTYFSNKLSPQRPQAQDRIEFALDFFKDRVFSRKDYCGLHKGLSTATASRDLAKAVKLKKLKMSGLKALSTYQRYKV